MGIGIIIIKSKIVGEDMQNQEGIEKAFFEQIKAGDYVDARYGDDDWKVAKVVDRQNKYLNLIYDGFPPNNEQLYINPMRVKPLRAITTAYTGPQRGIYSTITSIPQLIRHTEVIDTMLKSTDPPSPFRVTQYLRGEFFCAVNMLLMSDLRLSGEETGLINNFFIQVVDRIGKICVKAKEFLPEYFEANGNTKFGYLSNFKLAIVWSLQQLLYLANLFLAQGAQTPRLLKTYKNELSQPNLLNSLKQYLPVLLQLLTANDINGRWLPTFTRLNISKILMKYKEDEKFLSIPYNVKDYLQFYSYWPAVLQLCPTENNQRKLLDYVQNVMCKQSPFDAKLKSLVMLRKILDKQYKFNVMSFSTIVEQINSKKIVDSLLKYFNPQIFKRYIPILKTLSQHSKKSLTQAQIDDLFKTMKTSHESDLILIYQIIVSISQFIGVDTLDNIYTDIEQNIDVNDENGIKFVRDFTVKAIGNFNMNRNKGFFSALIGRKRNSGKFGYYGLDLLFKHVQDGGGKIEPKNIAFVIANIGVIFANESFHQERMSYMQACIANIDKRESYGQSVKLLGEIICTYPLTAYIGDSQESVVGKLDDKHKLVDTLIKGLKPLQKECNSQTSKNINTIKVRFEQSIKYCYNFIEQFNPYFKHPLQLRHINHLWHMPFIFEFLRKSKQNLDNEIPSWKKKYYKKLSQENIKGILMEIIKADQNIIPTEQCFDAIHELILTFNLNKSLQLTERATIRYKNLSNVIGLNFYFKFLEKLITLYKSDWKKGKGEPKNNQLVEKVIRIIFEIHLRPHDYYAIEVKCENWLKCLMKVAKCVYRENTEICVGSIQLFLELIRGRQFKDISAVGKLEILVSYESKEKTITLPKNATILRLRNSIMEAYKIKWNFEMYNTSLKRQIKFIEEEDFSIYAMGVSIKGPTIIIKKVQQKELYPQYEACQKFMNLIESQQQFYKIVFGLLQGENSPTLHARIWKIIQKIPVNRATKQKIKNCKDFTKKDWEQFLLPTRMEELQYSINIVESLLKTVSWMEDFKKTQGNVVIQELYLTMLGSNQPLSEKIKINLSKILLKILEHGSGHGQDKEKAVEAPKMEQKEVENVQNLSKISMKIMQFLQKIVDRLEVNKPEQQKSPIPSIQCLNLMMKMLISASTKKSCPQIEVLIKYFLHDGILLKISDLILFQPKDIDTTFFTQDILQKTTLQMNLESSYKHEILRQFIKKYLNYSILLTKKSTENYFLYLIDFLHSMDKEESVTFFANNPEIILLVKDYIDSTLDGREKGKEEDGAGQKLEPSQEMIHGCFKLLNETCNYAVFQYDIEKIFNVMLENFVLTESSTRQPPLASTPPKTDQKSLQQSKSLKTKIKSKKILYEIMKSMIYSNERNLNIFVDKVAPKLQNAQWRRNIYTSWSLEQQKKEKKFYCGLENLAATCYINCLFQQLFMIKRFTDRFVNIDSLAYKEQQESNEIYQLQKLLIYLKYGNKRSYTTRPFCQSFITYEGVPIDPTVQNDADQFFNALMEKIQGFLKSAGHHSILEDTFEGKLSNQLNCEGCPHSSEKIQPFLSIGLNIKNKKTLEAALDGYVQGQILDGDNAYFCQKCQKKVRTMKRLCIKQVPNILVVVLKRFTYNFDQMRKIKINDQLKFPQELNIKKYTSEFNLGQECKADGYYDYKLRGVVIHSGTSEGGHYYSFIKDEGKDKDKDKEPGAKWFQFNDQSIEEADYKRIQEDGFGGEEKDSEFKIEKHKSAYILFYQKQTLIEKPNPKPQKQPIIPQQPFESQLAEQVKSQNRNSDFLSIILDQLFIRLCENIAMCGHKNAHHFIILYFHTVLLRDRNKEEYLANIYRIILTLVNGSGELCVWFLGQIDQGYVREFLVQAPKMVKYLCLGLVVQAMKVLGKCESQIRDGLRLGVGDRIKVAIQAVEKVEEKKKEVKIEEPAKEEVKEEEKKAVDEQKEKEEKEELNIQQPETSVEQQSKEQPPQVQPQPEQPQPPKEAPSDLPESTITLYQQQIKKLIPILLNCLKPKGMSPFAKIFTYLSSIPMYRHELQKYQYAERVAQILLASNSQGFKKVEYESRESFFGRQNPSCKEKQLQMSYSFLIQSLRYHPSTLTKQQILTLLTSAQSRPSTKTLTYLLTKTTQSPEQALQNLETYKSKLMDDKYKREDIQRFMFLIRYYYLMVEARGKKIGDDEFGDSVKVICLDCLAAVVKSNEGSYQLMELLLIEVNKLAFKREDFAGRWMEKVNSNQGLYKALNYWVAESRRPHFLQRCEQWKRKTANLSYQQKDQLILQNQATQEQRTNWMFKKRQERIKQEQEKKKSKKTAAIGQEINMETYEFEESKKKDQEKEGKIPEIHSELELTEINKTVVIGFRSFKIVDRLGILTKIEDEKGLHRWAILERSDVQTYIDF